MLRGRRMGWKGWTATVLVGLFVLGALAGGSEEKSDESSGRPAPTSETAPSSTPDATAEPTPEPEVDVRVSKPSRGATVRAPRVTIRGSVEPRTARVKVEGKRVAVRRGRFAHAVNLDVGSNRILVEGTAEGFTRFESTREITRKRSAAELAVIRAKREEARRARIEAMTKRFSGNGQQNIGSFEVETESVLEWTNVENEFPEFRQMLIYDKGFGVSVTSDAGSGRTILEPGRYRSVTVAGGDWTITIRPR
jgi:hypothetical protein